VFIYMQHRLAVRRALPHLHAHLTVLLLYRETPCHAPDIPHLLRILYPLTHDASRVILPRPTSRSFLYACVYDVDLLTVASIRQCVCPSFVAETPPPLHFPITQSHLHTPPAYGTRIMSCLVTAAALGPNLCIRLLADCNMCVAGRVQLID
jgi:hypothetical protein